MQHHRSKTTRVARVLLCVAVTVLFASVTQAAPFAFVEESIFLSRAGETYKGQLGPNSHQEYTGTFRDDQKAVFEARFRHAYPQLDPCPTFEIHVFDANRNKLLTAEAFPREKDCVAIAGVEIKYSQNYRTLYARVVNEQTVNTVQFELKIDSRKPEPDEGE